MQGTLDWIDGISDLPRRGKLSYMGVRWQEVTKACQQKWRFE
jgi:hypothetical protein